MKIYEELHCKPIYGAKSCCPKRFECPENTLRFDANKCAFDDKFYKIGEVLNFSNESTCLETCICSRLVAIVTFNLSLLLLLLCFNIYRRYLIFWSYIRRYDNEPAKFQCSTFDCGDDDKVKVDKLVGGCVKTYNGVQECCSASIVCGMNYKNMQKCQHFLLNHACNLWNFYTFYVTRWRWERKACNMLGRISVISRGREICL